MLTIRNCSNDFHLILQRVHRKSRQNIYQSYVIQIRYMADSNRDLIKAEKFLKEGDYEEVIERSFKILEKCLIELYQKIFTKLDIDLQMEILTDLKENYNGKKFEKSLLMLQMLME